MKKILFLITIFSVTTKSLNGMECSELDERKQIIKSYAQHVAQNPKKVSKEIIHIALSININKKYLNIPINELENNPINTLTGRYFQNLTQMMLYNEIIKNIFSEKHSLNHLINSNENSNITINNNNIKILFPSGSSLFYKNKINTIVVSQKKNTYRLTNTNPEIKLTEKDKQGRDLNGINFKPNSNYISYSITTNTIPSFVFNTSKNSNTFCIQTNNLKLDDECSITNSATTFYKKRSTEQTIHTSFSYFKHYFPSLTKGPIVSYYDDIEKDIKVFTTAFGISKNNKIRLNSLSSQHGKHILQALQRYYICHPYLNFAIAKEWLAQQSCNDIDPFFINEDFTNKTISISSPFKAFTPITPNIFAGCTKKGDLYFIELRSTQKWFFEFGSLDNITIHPYKQHLPKNIRVKQIASNPSCPREFVFVVEKTIKDKNNDNKKIKIILCHTYIDKDFTKENKIFFSKLEKLKKVPEHLGFHKDYVTISNTYTETDTNQKKDFGVIVRKIPLTKRWLYLANNIKTRNKLHNNANNITS